ncbi:axonemal dynein light chain domain-containing protein 1 [Ara ararauna]
MPTTGAPVPGQKAGARKPSCASWAGEDRSEMRKLRGTPRMLGHIKPVSSSLEHSFVPEEVFRSLTCASSSLYSPKYFWSPQTTKPPMGFRQVQIPDRPPCQFDRRWKSASLTDSLIPEEFHIVRNRGDLPLKYFDDKYATLLEDREKKLRLFPSLRPPGRLEVIQLMHLMDSMLEKAGVDKLIRVTGSSQLHNMLELLKAEQNIYNILFHKLIRQVSVDCVERGQLLSKLRQRYVSLLEQNPEQMKALYKKMMSQQLVNRHITEELLYFKESVGQLSNELYKVGEPDRKVTEEAEKAQEELHAAMQESKTNVKLLEEYQKLDTLRGRQLEEQALLLAQERDIWIAAMYDLARKIIDRNQLTLVRQLHVGGKTFTNVLKHFINLLTSEDTEDLTDLQEKTEQFRERLGFVGAEIECSEESTQRKLQTVCSSFNKHLQYFHSSDSSSQMNEKLLDGILPEIKNLINMLKEDLEQYTGEVHLRKTESLKSTASLLEYWTKLGQTVINRRRDLTGALPPQHTALEEIKQRACELYRQYNIRINGNNGTAKFLTALVKCMEDWLFKVQKLKQGSGMHKAELCAFYQKIPAWLAQVDAVKNCVGSGQLDEAESDQKSHFLWWGPWQRKLPVGYTQSATVLKVVPKEFFHMIQQWVLSMNNETEENVTHANEKVTELDRNLTLWLVDLLRHMTTERLSHECSQWQESGTEMDKEPRLLRASKLQHGAKELVAEMCRLAGSVDSCCCKTINEIVQKKQSEKDLEADFELEELNKIKTECCNWIQACSHLLSEIKGTPVSFLDLEELRNLFGSEELQLKLKLKDTIISSTQEEFEAENAISKTKPITEEEPLKVKEEIAIMQHPGAGMDYLIEDNEATADMIRYVGHDSNVYLKSLKSDIITVTGREMTASTPSSPFSQKEFEALAMLEHLQVQLLEREIRAQNVKERSEGLEEKLEEALQRIHDLGSELERGKSSQKQQKGKIRRTSISNPLPDSEREAVFEDTSFVSCLAQDPVLLGTSLGFVKTLCQKPSKETFNMILDQGKKNC